MILLERKGQAVFEYVLMLALAVSLYTLISTSYKRGLFNFWAMITREVAAACPGCPPPSGIRFR